MEVKRTCLQVSLVFTMSKCVLCHNSLRPLRVREYRLLSNVYDKNWQIRGVLSFWLCMNPLVGNSPDCHHFIAFMGPPTPSSLYICFWNSFYAFKNMVHKGLEQLLSASRENLLLSSFWAPFGYIVREARCLHSPTLFPLIHSVSRPAFLNPHSWSPPWE